MHENPQVAIVLFVAGSRRKKNKYKNSNPKTPRRTLVFNTCFFKLKLYYGLPSLPKSI